MSLEGFWLTLRQLLPRGHGFDEERCVLSHDTASEALDFYTDAGRNLRSTTEAFANSNKEETALAVTAKIMPAKPREGAKEIYYPGAPHGLTVTLQDQVNAELLGFIAEKEKLKAA